MKKENFNIVSLFSKHIYESSPPAQTGMMVVIRAAGRHTHGQRRGCRGRLSGGSGRGDPRSGPWGIAGEVPRAVAAVMPSVQPCACRRVGRGCRARPRSRHLSSGRCGSCSGPRPSIPDGLPQPVRHDGRRSDNRSLTSSGYPFCATYRSERPNSPGLASLPNSERQSTL